MSIKVENLRKTFGSHRAVDDVSFDIPDNALFCVVGLSGCGKSTSLKLLNRMHDVQRGVRIEGSIRMNGKDIYAPDIDPPLYRKRFGWVAQKPSPFAMSIYDNVACGARIHGLARSGAELDAHVQHCLEKAHLWDEVKDSLHDQQGIDLSGGQQQRLCIARAIATEPEVLLMDEATGSIDPIATARVEAQMTDLRADHAIVVVTHSMMEAKRIADRVAFFHMRRLFEIGSADQVFTAAKDERTRNFIEGKIG